jgi:hypothetical protein
LYKGSEDLMKRIEVVAMFADSLKEASGKVSHSNVNNSN